MSNIPEHKHSDKELSDLRAQSAMQAANSPIAATYNKKLAHKGIVILGYALPFTAPLWSFIKSMTKDEVHTMSDFWIMAIPILIALVIALWIALRRVLSRHNSAFILIISLLCCFAIVSVVNSDKYLRHELMSIIGKDEPMPDPFLDTEPAVNDSADSLTEEEREQLKEWDSKRKAFEAGQSTKPTPSPVVPSPSIVPATPDVPATPSAPAIPSIPKLPSAPATPAMPSESPAPEPVSPGIE